MVAPTCTQEAGADIAQAVQSNIHCLPPEVLLNVLVRAGAWPKEEGVVLGVSKSSPVPPSSFNWAQERTEAPRDLAISSAMSVCRQWRDAVKGSVVHGIAALLLEVHNSVEGALVGACSIGNEAVVRHLLELPRPEPS
jgi:hypothetical protein